MRGGTTTNDGRWEGGGGGFAGFVRQSRRVEARMCGEVLLFLEVTLATTQDFSRRLSPQQGGQEGGVYGK